MPQTWLPHKGTRRRNILKFQALRTSAFFLAARRCVLRSRRPAQSDPAQTVEQLIHLKLFWKPIPGTTFAESSQTDALMTYAAPGVVYDTTPSGFGVYEGQAAIREFIEGYWYAFEDLRLELEEFLDLGNGVTFAVSDVDEGRTAARRLAASRP